MKQILVDMDGVLADVYAQFIKWELEETGNLIDINSLSGKTEEEAFPQADKHVRSKGFFRTVTPIKDSIEGLKYLNDKYNVLIVSSATEFPQSLTEKVEWLHKFYPFITWQQIVLCGRKDMVKGDIMIDDHSKNLKLFEGRKLLFTQPQNMYISEPDYERIYTWKEIMDLL